MYKCVVLDFNGTLLNDVDLCLSILNTMLEQEGKKKIDYETYREIFTFPIIDYYIKAGFDFKGRTYNELAEFYIKNYQKKSLDCLLSPYAREILELLKEKKIKIVLLSASKMGNLIEQINHFDIAQYFDDVLALDDIHATSKESIAIEYFRKNAIDPKKTLFIGDTDHDFDVAYKVGASCCLVSNGHQSQNVLKRKTNLVFDSLERVYELLRKGVEI